MKPCTACGHENQDWTDYCVACGRPMASATDEDVQASHLAWLLRRIPEWRRRGLIPPGSATRLMQECRFELEDARRRTPAPAPTVPPVAAPEATASQRPRELAAALPPSPHVQGPASLGSAQAGGGLAEFLEQHWLKLLAVLAAAFIFAGMRQVLGWEWVSRLAVLLIPAVPLARIIRERSKGSALCRTS